ncbi:hypothetical protein KC906_03610 [Candidatus Kaiserbacteria bacterium]|nr:hypothetical protein [Candidatus Kaiserbacteria bacterium]MCB9812454.1 hypothetical protein [Candidatus Nomurabacteria bacterium]
MRFIILGLCSLGIVACGSTVPMVSDDSPCTGVLIEHELVRDSYPLLQKGSDHAE